MQEIEKLYLLYKDDLYRYLLSLTSDPNLSEDLLSETFVRAISSIKNFQGKSSLKTWLFSIGRKLWIDHLRKTRKTLDYKDFLEIYISKSLDEKIIEGEKIGRIKALLGEKDERTQKVVNLRIKGYSFREIGEEVGISEGSARVIDFRTKKWIRKVLEEEGLS